MKTKFQSTCWAVVVFVFLALVQSVCAQGTAFTYQGRLASGGNAATGLYDFNFALYDAASAGAQQGATLTTNGVAVTNGYFIVVLDFGGTAFTGGARWLEIAVRTNSGVRFLFTKLAPRQALTPTPYAAYAALAANLASSLPAGQLSGTYPNALTLNNPGNSFIGAMTATSLQLDGCINTGGNSVALGDHTTASGVASAALGYQTTGSGSYSTALGVQTYATGWGSTALGQSSVASGGDATALGSYTVASGEYSTALGRLSQATNSCATAMGSNTVASGRTSTAMGVGTRASGDFSTAIGNRTTASGFSSLAAGEFGQAKGWASFAIGYSGVANGRESFALGTYANADHDNCFVWSDGTDQFFGSTAPDQFAVRATGGVVIGPGSSVGIGAAPGDALLDVQGNVRLNQHELLFRNSTDRNHGLGWYGAGKLFATVNVDGPVLYGSSGGGLGSTGGGQKLALQWNNAGNVIIDPGGLNAGDASPGPMAYALTPGLVFGGNSGEGISSQRKDNGLLDNQYGLDFYTQSVPRVRINQNGLVGIRRIPTINQLEVEGEASKTVPGLWAFNSDARIKTDITTVTNAAETLDRVRLVAYRYNAEYLAAHPVLKDRAYLNVIAQEFQQVFPDYVKGSGEKLPDGSEILQVDPYPLVIYSAAAVQELRQQLQARDARIRQLEQRLDRLERLFDTTR